MKKSKAKWDLEHLKIPVTASAMVRSAPLSQPKKIPPPPKKKKNIKKS